MSVEKVYISKQGKSYKLSEHFTLGEFQCKDGSDKVLYSPKLMHMLEELRSYVGGKITINSGYRTSSYNISIGGAASSMHTKGYAADIVVKDHNSKVIPAKYICCLCQSLGFKGIAYISANAVHVDMRPYGSYRGDERKGYGNNLKGDFYSYFKVSASTIKNLKYVEPTKPSKPIPVPDKKESVKEEVKEEDEMIFKDISEVPEWGKKSVQFRIDKGYTDGKKLEQSLVRSWVALDREDPYIKNIDDVPESLKPETKELINAGYIKGNGSEPIGMRTSTLRSVIISARMLK